MVKHRQDMARVGSTALGMAAEVTLFSIDTREELINALHEAIQIEHGLMLQYLYAVLSCKRSPCEGLDDRQMEVVRDWEGRLLKIARDEMAHLATACNLLNAVGGTPNFVRPNFPQPTGRWFPFDFQLEKLNDASLLRFVRAESPASRSGAQPPAIAPDPITYDYVGELYRSIALPGRRVGRRSPTAPPLDTHTEHGGGAPACEYPGRGVSAGGWRWGAPGGEFPRRQRKNAVWNSYPPAGP
jgi:hypothetical protein